MARLGWFFVATLIYIYIFASRVLLCATAAAVGGLREFDGACDARFCTAVYHTGGR